MYQSRIFKMSYDIQHWQFYDIFFNSAVLDTFHFYSNPFSVKNKLSLSLTQTLFLIAYGVSFFSKKKYVESMGTLWEIILILPNIEWLFYWYVYDMVILQIKRDCQINVINFQNMKWRVRMMMLFGMKIPWYV